jgi:hypothetical protein
VERNWEQKQFILIVSSVLQQGTPHVRRLPAHVEDFNERISLVQTLVPRPTDIYRSRTVFSIFLAWCGFRRFCVPIAPLSR